MHGSGMGSLIGSETLGKMSSHCLHLQHLQMDPQSDIPYRQTAVLVITIIGARSWRLNLFWYTESSSRRIIGTESTRPDQTPIKNEISVLCITAVIPRRRRGKGMVYGLSQRVKRQKVLGYLHYLVLRHSQKNPETPDYCTRYCTRTSNALVPSSSVKQGKITDIDVLHRQNWVLGCTADVDGAAKKAFLRLHRLFCYTTRIMQLWRDIREKDICTTRCNANDTGQAW